MDFIGSKIWQSSEGKHFAQGGNSFVYMVKGELGEEFALKLYKFDNFSGERYKRFLAEISVVKDLAGVDGCVSYVDHGFHGGKPFYVMPYFPNGTFRDKYFGTSSYSEKEKLEDFLKLLQVVRSIHSTGLAIRDIKPQNILIDNEGNPVVADFGLSLWVDICDEERETPVDGMVGSQGYRPPEWHTRYPEPNHRPGDIWSLGRTLWAMMTGINPPNNYETLGCNGTHVNQYVDKRYANIVQSLITACTGQDPAHRPVIDELINHAKNICSLVEESSQEDIRRKEAIAQTLARFHLQISNSEVYIDSQRLESEINIKISEIEGSASLLIESLKGYASDIAKGVPSDLGVFRVIHHMPAGVFLDSRQLTIDVSENRSWGKVVSLRFDPSEMMEIHKSLSYIDLSFYIGLTKLKNFYWIVQLRDQSIVKSEIIEQIEPKSLAGVVSQKVKQLDEFVGQYFLPSLEKHFK